MFCVALAVLLVARASCGYLADPRFASASLVRSLPLFARRPRTSGICVVCPGWRRSPRCQTPGSRDKQRDTGSGACTSWTPVGSWGRELVTHRRAFLITCGLLRTPRRAARTPLTGDKIDTRDLRARDGVFDVCSTLTLSVNTRGRGREVLSVRSHNKSRPYPQART